MDEHSLIVADGGAVKATEAGRISGYLVVFTDPATPDLEGDYFTKDTDFGTHETTPIYFHHGKSKLGNRRIGEATLRKDDVGVFMEGILYEADEYEKALAEAIRRGSYKGKPFAVGLSSGTAGHLVEREARDGAYWVKSWPLGLDGSITHQPAEPKTRRYTSAKSVDAIGELDVDAFIKSLLSDEAEQQGAGSTGGAVADAGQITPDAVSEGETEMTDEIQAAAAAAVAKALAERDAEVKAAQELEAKLQAAREEGRKQGIEEQQKATKPGWTTNIRTSESAAGVYDGNSNDQIKAFVNWVHTGNGRIMEADGMAYKDAVTQGVAAEGGYAVPEIWLGSIVDTVNVQSVVRAAGAITHSHNARYFHIPYMGTDVTSAYKAENTALDDGVASDFLAERKVELFRMGSYARISLEAEANAQGLQTLFTRQIAKSIAKLENTWFINGTGSNQARGLLNRGTAFTTGVTASTTTLQNIQDLTYSLPDDYSDGAVFLTKRLNLGTYRSITGDPAYFPVIGPSDGDGRGNGGVSFREFLNGHMVHTSSEMGAANTASTKPLAIFQPSEYHIVDHTMGLLVQRNPYILMKEGAVELVWQRWVGADLPQATACYYLQHPTA